MALATLKKQTAAQAVAWAHETLELAYTEIGAAVDADERTVRRWQEQGVAPRGRHQDKVQELLELRHLLKELFPTTAEANGWLHASVPAFRGRTPISLLRSGKMDAVIDVLATMESGSFL